MQGDGDGCHDDRAPECREILVAACAGGRPFSSFNPREVIRMANGCARISYQGAEFTVE